MNIDEVRDLAEQKNKKTTAKTTAKKTETKSAKSSDKKTETKSADKPKKETTAVKTALIGIMVGLFSGVAFSAAMNATDFILDSLSKEPIQHVEVTDIPSTDIEIVVSDNEDTIETSITKVAKNVMPSVVSITNLSVQEVEYFFFGTQKYETENTGSGIIIGKNDTELLIVTNNHVVEGYKTLTVSFIDGESIEATVKGTDADIDIAVVAVPLGSIKAETLDQIKVATIGNSDAVVVGEPAIAIGNALGYGQSVTSGIVSALGRSIDMLDTKLIQTDSAINPGNSGGALLNIKGEVIGINTVKVSADAVESMGYAIPISDVQEVINGLMNRETREKVIEAKRGILGITGVDVDAMAIQYYNMPEGVYVSELVAGGAAEKAGLPVNSIITKIDGNSVDSMEELQEELQYYRAGDKVELTIQVQDRTGYVKEKIEITLGKAN